jgi:sugar lactone lactonase YvrE
VKGRVHEPLVVNVVAEDLGFPEGPVILADGTLLAVDIEGGRVFRVDGVQVSVVANTEGGPNPIPGDVTTNIAFGGTDMTSAVISLSRSGKRARCHWPRPGLKLNVG